MNLRLSIFRKSESLRLGTFFSNVIKEKIFVSTCIHCHQCVKYGDLFPDFSPMNFGFYNKRKFTVAKRSGSRKSFSFTVLFIINLKHMILEWEWLNFTVMSFPDIHSCIQVISVWRMRSFHFTGVTTWTRRLNRMNNATIVLTCKKTALG